MNIKLEKYIFPISGSGEKEGVGVVVGDLLITAGHVVEGMDSFSIFIDKINYKVSKKQILALSTLPSSERKTTDFDICVFKLDGINSPLTLATELPDIGTQLLSISYKHIIKAADSEEGKDLFSKIPVETIEIRYSMGSISEKENNFFGCDMSEPLEEGRSGSPILADGKVYGILVGGNNNGNLCVYQSSKSIIEFFKIHNIKI